MSNAKGSYHFYHYREGRGMSVCGLTRIFWGGQSGFLSQWVEGG